MTFLLQFAEMRRFFGTRFAHYNLFDSVLIKYFPNPRQACKTSRPGFSIRSEEACLLSMRFLVVVHAHSPPLAVVQYFYRNHQSFGVMAFERCQEHEVLDSRHD